MAPRVPTASDWEPSPDCAMGRRNSFLHGVRHEGEAMKTRLGMVAASLSTFLVTLPGITQASGGGPIPQIAGTWHGQMQFQIVVNLTTQLITRQVVMTLDEDPAGNLGGLFCQSDSTAFPPFCQPLIGRVQSNGAVQIEFSNNAGGNTTKLKGSITGTIGCLDGSTGLVIAGTFQTREHVGTFSVNNCPLPQ